MGSNQMRNLFFEKIEGLLDSEDVYIVSADLAGPPFDSIRSKHSNRYVSVGIAEQNLISVSCGIAMTGKRVIAYAANPFIAFRAFDQIRNAIGVMNIPVTIVGLGTGFSVSVCGVTHFSTEDIAMMSLCPGIKCITANDSAVVEYALELFKKRQSPLYIRFDRDCDEDLSNRQIDTNNGWRYIKKTNDLVYDKLIISQGYASHVVNSIVFDSNPPSLMDVYETPFDEVSFVKEVVNYKRILVVEEQQLRGGLGSIVLEIFNSFDVSVPIRRIGIDYSGRFPNHYGSRDYWLDYYGINASKIKEFVDLKENKV